jgi:hypothetical protein
MTQPPCKKLGLPVYTVLVAYKRVGNGTVDSTHTVPLFAASVRFTFEHGCYGSHLIEGKTSWQGEGDWGIEKDRQIEITVPDELVSCFSYDMAQALTVAASAPKESSITLGRGIDVESFERVCDYFGVNVPLDKLFPHDDCTVAERLDHENYIKCAKTTESCVDWFKIHCCAAPFDSVLVYPPKQATDWGCDLKCENQRSNLHFQEFAAMQVNSGCGCAISLWMIQEKFQKRFTAGLLTQGLSVTWKLKSLIVGEYWDSDAGEHAPRYSSRMCALVSLIPRSKRKVEEIDGVSKKTKFHVEILSDENDESDE